MHSSTNITRRKLNLAILTALRDGPLRYSRLHHAVSQTSLEVVHARTLTRTLTHLQEEGLVEHHQEADTADYRLTIAGTELVDLLAELERWTREHRTDDRDEDDR
ncbi:winged helix-turn-helix transcriptional regulator [Couchioplanes azureus]|uniref:winged helix-turn-helix transcriptional regulator n=1 Tax=Couchioplanes caeruleus TaxID=56438 RepID=UPI0016702B3C|nr:winged helix-turn-helix transcriptional regulator [Couchioplanes caeruleus]